MTTRVPTHWSLRGLGFDREGFAGLRQRMLSSTVENKTKLAWLRQVYCGRASLLDAALGM